jgi:histidinol-phosphatase (PHP family)
MDSVYEWEMTRLCRELKKLGIPLEINMLGMGGGRHYPAEHFWKLAGEVGNEVLIALDAHSVDQIRDVETYLRCKDLAEKYNLNLINKLDFGGKR